MRIHRLRSGLRALHGVLERQGTQETDQRISLITAPGFLENHGRCAWEDARVLGGHQGGTR
eukprot:3100733-Alexandrium_andersonii.AAC.1